MIRFVTTFVVHIALRSLSVFCCFPTAWRWSHQLSTPKVYQFLCYEDIKKTFDFATLQTVNPFILLYILYYQTPQQYCKVMSAKSLCYENCREQTFTLEASATVAIFRCCAVSQTSIKPGWMRIWSDRYDMLLLWALYWESVL